MARTLEAYRRMADCLDEMDDEELDELRRDIEEHDREGWSGTLLEAVEAEIVGRFVSR